MIALLTTILVSIAGRQFGFYPSGLDAYSGYCMAASSFLALAYAFANGDHISVTLVISRLGQKARRRAELLSVSIPILPFGAFAFFSLEDPRHSNECVRAGPSCG